MTLAKDDEATAKIVRNIMQDNGPDFYSNGGLGGRFFSYTKELPSFNVGLLIPINPFSQKYGFTGSITSKIHARPEKEFQSYTNYLIAEDTLIRKEYELLLRQFNPLKDFLETIHFGGPKIYSPEDLERVVSDFDSL